MTRKISLDPNSFIALTGRLLRQSNFIRIGRSRIVVLDTPDAIARAGKAEKSGRLSRQQFTMDLAPILGQGAFTAPEDEWVHHKRTIMRHLTPSRENVAHWHSAARQAVDLALETYGSVWNDAERVCRLLSHWILVGSLFGDHHALDPRKSRMLLGIMRWNAEVATGVRLLLSDWADPVMAPFRTAGKLAGDRFDRMIAQAKAVPGYPAANPDFRKEIRSLLFAGLETLALALLFTLWLVASDRDLQERLRLELKTEGKDAPLLEKIIMESLRYLPPAHTTPPRVCKQDTPIGNLTVPKGQAVLYSIWHAHRCGPGWDRFDPDRHADLKEGHDFLPFGTGPKRCVGAHLAKLTLRTALAELLLRHGVETPTQTLLLSSYTSLKPKRKICLRWQ